MVVPPTLKCIALSWAVLLLVGGTRAWAGDVVVPDRAVLPLDELGRYEVGYQRRGAASTSLPVGWMGGLDSPTGVACQPSGTQNGKPAWLLHCPWRDGTGVAFQTFSVALPAVPRLTLSGLTALRADAVGKSDGVVYRVFVNGQKRFESHRADADWQPFSLDLTPEAGKTVELRFETDPGPRNDASFDFSLWGERRLEMPGFTPPAATHPIPPPLDLGKLASSQNGSVVPLSGFPGKTDARVLSSEAILSYQGPDGALEYYWNPGGADSLLGEVTLRARMDKDSQVKVPLAAQAHLEWTAEAVPTGSRLDAARPATGEPQAVLTRTYTVGGQTAALKITAAVQAKSLVFDVECDRPLVRALDGGGWGPATYRRPINVPYYSWPILFLVKENLFAGAFLDWTASRASSHHGTRAVYDPRTDGTRSLLHERLVYTAAWHLDETLPNLPNPPSPFRADLAGRTVLDIWGGSFADIQARLRTLAEGGLGPGVAIVHNWQVGGYDNELPRHLPANASLGGDTAMAALVRQGERDGIRMALHENYVDYYPNAPGFAETDLARATDGSPVKAWLNTATHVQSFAVKPTRILPLAKTQGPEILRRFGGSACFLDVHSAVAPWFHVDFERNQPGAGEFGPVWDAHRALWAYERVLHRGPVFGEGNDHWRWSGALDGVEAQFGQGWPEKLGTDAPLLVDFDLLRIHPLQLNHGMGYYERWWPRAPDTRQDLIKRLDQYRMQEAIFGHQGFRGGDAWHDPALAWLESHLLTPLTARTALARPVAIDYAAPGGRWLDASAVVREGGDWSQVRVRYDNGLTVWANGGGQPLPVEETVVPPNGWWARGAGLTAGTTLRAGVVSDLAETPDSVFVNARAAADWEQPPGSTRIRPLVVRFTPTAPRAFRVSYQWEAAQAVPEDLACFVHFFPAGSDQKTERISFQQDHKLALPTSRWKPGEKLTDGPWDVTVPKGTPPGDYLWTVGLFRADGSRVDLQGPSDPHRRLILGTLHVATDATLTFTAAPDPSTGEARVSGGQVLDFGPIRTDGSVFVCREGADWVLRPFPADRAFTVELATARFGSPPGVPVRQGWWRLNLTGERTYRWPAPK